MKKYQSIFFLCCLLQSYLLFGQSGMQLIDKNASTETNNLYYNLIQLSRHYILFGHQHATQYGHGWEGDADRSDVKSVAGSHPAVIGVDFSGLSGRPDSVIDKEKIALRKNISDTYNRGGITTVSWHFSNPVSKGDFYWNDSVSAPAVKMIIPGGSHHEKYKKILQTIAGFSTSVEGDDGKLVPMIFRPFHELDGNWFWWGKAHCTVEEITGLWKFTVTYLRDSLHVHNFIYAFSPDNSFTSEATYLERYPGDNYVDIVGVDDYNDFGRYGKYNLDSGIIRLKIVNDYAHKANKVAAFTETGLESIPNANWWTKILLWSLKQANVQMAYVLVWRNDKTSPTHFYAPFPGQVSAADFLKFYNDPCTLFENDLPKMYIKNRN
jgi:mannan endo-1,4-beta-mannosidase